MKYSARMVIATGLAVAAFAGSIKGHQSSKPSNLSKAVDKVGRAALYGIGAWVVNYGLTGLFRPDLSLRGACRLFGCAAVIGLMRHHQSNTKEKKGPNPFSFDEIIVWQSLYTALIFAALPAGQYLAYRVDFLFGCLHRVVRTLV